MEVFYQGAWGTVCDDEWDMADANVVCRMLGYHGACAAYGRAFFGPGSGEIVLDDVECTGAEPTLAECVHSPFGLHNCVHREDAGVKCSHEREGRAAVHAG